MNILAIDPGERCGWARATLDPETGKLTRKRHGITALRDMALTLAERASEYDVLIYETFRLTPKGARVLIGSDLQTAQMVGMIRLAGWMHGCLLVAQGPSIKAHARQSAPPWLVNKLKKMPKSHDDAHDGDALLHLHYYAFKTSA